MTFEQVFPGVWRWADPDGSDRCGTALGANGETILVDPPALPAAARRAIEGEAGPIRHVVLTSAQLAPRAAPFRAQGATVWAPRLSEDEPAADGVDSFFNFDTKLPGGLLVSHIPQEAVPHGQVAMLWPHAGDGLLIVGDLLPVIGQTPIYLEGQSPPMPAFLAAIRALLASDPGTLAPAHHAPPERAVAFSTAYAARIGSPYHARNAAPVAGPRFLVPQAERVLAETLVAPVVLRSPAFAATASANGHPAAGAAADQPIGWVPDPWACIRCGKSNQPMPQTCGGPPIPRLCPDCRAEERRQLPAARLMVCAGGCCTREGARAVASAARQAARAAGIGEVVDVVPVSCLGECSLGPFVRIATEHGREPDFVRTFREESGTRARVYAADEGEIVDAESELVLSRFAALVQPDEAERLVQRLARTIPAAEHLEDEREGHADGRDEAGRAGAAGRAH